MQVHQEFVSAGVNRIVNALSWSDGDCVAYGSHHMIALYDPKAVQVVATLRGHNSSVDCVSWLPHSLLAHVTPAATEILVSGAADGELRVWAVHQRGRAAATPWQLLATLQGHTGPVTGIAFHALPPNPGKPPGSFIMVTTAGDTAVRVWECCPATVSASQDQPAAAQNGSGVRDTSVYGQHSWSCTSTIPVGTQMQQTVGLTYLPGHEDWLLLVTGGTDSRLHLHCRAPGASTFQPVLKLPGHDGWIRAMALHHVATPRGTATELMIATASQDRYGRIWKVCLEDDGQHHDHHPSPSSGAIVDDDVDVLSTIMRYSPRPGFEAAGNRFSVTLESLLIGHEDWVHSVCWRPLKEVSKINGKGLPDRTSLCLLSTSMDRTMMLWTYESSSGLWMSVASVGDAGAACLGYFGGVFSPDGNSIMAHGFTGAIHLWDHDLNRNDTNAHNVGSWTPRHALGGHWDSVTGVTWGCDGSCVMSVSDDQTARVFTATQTGQMHEQSEGHWCEIARTQVHGHDFSCVAALPHGTLAASYAYVSGSEEKVLRVMECTQAFLDTMTLLKGGMNKELIDDENEPSGQTEGRETRPMRTRAFGAAVSALGLTNKMVLEDGSGNKNGGVGSGMPGGTYEDGPDFVPNAVPSVVHEPPLEEHLAQNTLWPEGYKLYGHGDSLYCCAASPDGAYLASACVAKTEQQAAVWVWDVAGGTWKSVAQLPAHTLTVTQLSWSHDSTLLASCSRDRTFSLFQRIPSPPPPAPQQQGGSTTTQHLFRLVHRQKAAHTRILWGISWSHDDKLLATGARDNLIKIWGVNVNGDVGQACPADVVVSSRPLLTLPTFPAAVTALAWGPRSAPVSSAVQGTHEATAGQGYLLAVGLESGQLSLWQAWVVEGGSVQSACVWESPDGTSCAAQVNSVAWRNVHDGPLQLAVGSADHSVRVFRITVQ